MKTVHYGIGLGVVLTAVGTSLLIPAFAHEGHGKVETQGFDLTAPREVSPEVAALIGFATAEVDFGKLESVVELTGVVRALPDRVQAVGPRIAGTVENIHVRVGDRVQAGDALVELVSPEYLKLQAEKVQAEGRVTRLALELDSSRERATVAAQELSRVEANPDAVAANLASEKKSAEITARAAARSTEVELAQARAELDALSALIAVVAPAAEEHASERLVLRSSIDGVVVARVGVVGEGVEAGRAILQVADYTTVQVDAEVPESLLARISHTAGAVVRLRRNAEGDPVALGSVRFISPRIDPLKRTGHIIVEAENPDGALRDGMFVGATLVLREEQDAVVIPVTAMLKDGPVAFVFLEEKGLFRKQDITPGASDDRVVEVIAGLAPGDVIVTHGAYSVAQMRPKPQVPPEPGKEDEPKPEAKKASDGHDHSH